MGWQITPEGLTNLPLRWHQEFGSKIPAIYITENGCAYGDLPDANGEVNDVKRIDYLQKHLSALGNAIENGAPVKGYFQWSLMDNFEWALGYEKRFGIVYVDFKTQQRIIKNSGKWYMDIIKNNGAGL
jgi:beta-glucosidase